MVKVLNEIIKKLKVILNNSDALYQIETLYFYRYIDDDNNYIKAKVFF